MARRSLAALALVFALAHVPFLASSLDDIDAVNFALGVRDFDVAQHRPHPPGYPIYIALGKVTAALVRPLSGGAAPAFVEARALSILSLLAALVALPCLYFVMASWRSGRDWPPGLLATPWHRSDTRALAGAALTLACPLFWYLAARPLSDLPGLALATAAQASLALAWWRQQPEVSGSRRLTPERTAASGRMIVLGALLAALAIGMRTQTTLLTVPLLAIVLVDRIGRGAAGALLGASMAAAVGALAWLVPLLIASGGLDAYLAALGSQAGEDFAGGEMLYLNPTPRLVAIALLRTFVHPWDSLVLGGVVLVLAGIGAVALAVRDRRALIGVLAVSLPYLIFHLLFQDTSYVRYALPLVPPTVFLAVCGTAWLSARGVVPVTAALAVWALSIAIPVLSAYGSSDSPTARAVAAMEQARVQGAPEALALHQTFRRPLEAEALSIAPQLASPPRREWLELAAHWRQGHTGTVWLLADPRRSDLALVDPVSRGDRMAFAWPFASLSHLGGMRPAAADWYRMPPPGWFVEKGWALTPETAGVAKLMGAGPTIAPITGWIRRRPDPVRALIGGRHLGATTDPAMTFVVTVDGRDVARWTAGPGFFLEELELPAGMLEGAGPLAHLTIRSEGGEALAGRDSAAIEQFDLQTQGRVMWAYDTDWNEAEYEPLLGMWRWTTERSTLRIVGPDVPVTITLRVEDPRRYFDGDPNVRMVTADRVIATTNFRDGLAWSVRVPADALRAGQGRVRIETDRTFVPGDRDGSPDRRHLGLRIFAVDVVPEH